MTLPVPNLDDRRFQDIVDEAKLMIPRLIPEWTNHNISDPGVALIELYAWMTELTLYRLNQVPDRLYTQFLNLMGVSPFPARAAVADLTFWLSAVPDDPVVVPAGTEVATADGASAVVFATLEDLRIDQPVLTAALTGHGEDGLRDVRDELAYDRDSVTVFPSEPLRPEDAFYLGFDRTLAGQAVELLVSTASSGIGIDPQRPPIVWEAWTGDYWVPCLVHTDDTGGLNRTGSVMLMVPHRHEPLNLGGQRCWWLRVRLVAAAPGQPAYKSSPRVNHVRVACVGGTVTAEHSELIRDEMIGRSTGEAGQVFELANRPVLSRRDGENIVVVTESDEQTWDEVADFSSSGPDDRHVVWDEALGRIRFGPAIRYPDGSIVQHGAIPPAGGSVVVRAYRRGGGAQGNVGKGTLTSMRVGIPFIDRVENIAAARGGVDPEPVANVKERGPMTLRTGQRAVTAGDYERLALESTTEVARARCLPAERPGDPVRLMVVPRVAGPPDTYTIDGFAVNERLFSTVREHLDRRRVIGSVVEITAPYYVGVSVAALVRGSTGRPPTLVRQRVLDELYTALSPLGGGVDGQGWPWGTPLTTAALVSMIGSLEGVAAVDALVMFEVDLRNGVRLGDAVDVINVDERTLLLGSRHRVVVK
jgi:predicted phage baseplate assembly protein